MRKLLIVLPILSLSALPASALAQTAQEILEKSIEMDQVRKGAVQNYTIVQSTLNKRMVLHFEQVGGQSYIAFRQVPPDEIAGRQDPNRQLTPTELEAMAEDTRMAGDAYATELEKSGVPMGMLSAMGPPPGEERWASPDPRVSFGAMADFLDAAAEAQKQKGTRLAEDEADAANEASDMAQFVTTAQYVDIEHVRGYPAFHVRADELNYVPRMPEGAEQEGQEFVVNTVSLWLDTTHYVPLKFRMEGVVTAEGETRDMYIEKTDQYYKAFGPLYESTKQVMRIGGVLSPKELAELKKAEAQLAEFEEQMASMDPQQKKMMEGMLGPQIQMMRSMVRGGGIEVMNFVCNVLVNEGLPDPLFVGSRGLVESWGDTTAREVPACGGTVIPAK